MTVDTRAEIERNGGELAVAAALREEHFVLVGDGHDAAELRDGRGENGAEFGRAVREGHGAEAVGWEASLADDRFDDGWE